MAAYPTTPVWAYPLTRTLEFETRVAVGSDGTEQRWPIHAGRESWTLTYPRLSLLQRDTLISTFETAKGDFDQTLDFTFNGTTYTGCHFDAERFSAIERSPLQWTVTVVLRQVQRAPDTGALPADFPALTSGAKLQLPYTHERGFSNVIVRTEGGRFGFYRRATSLRTWSVGGPALSDAEAGAIWDMFRRARGRWSEFHFTDPDSATEYQHCRFADDRIEWQYLAKNQNAVEVAIQQVS